MLINVKKNFQEAFGSFRTESTVTNAALENAANVQGTMIPQMAHSSIGCPSSISTTSPISLPTSMQSSFEGEPSFTVPPSSSPQNVPPPPPPVTISPGPIHGLTSIQEYNLQQLASLAEKVDIVGDTGVVGSNSNPSPTPSFNIADLLTGDHAINNLQALAKLGNNLGNHGKHFDIHFFKFQFIEFIQFVERTIYFSLSKIKYNSNKLFNYIF